MSAFGPVKMPAFSHSWSFPAAVRDQLQFELEMRPLFYDVKPTGETFRTGRPKFEAVFTHQRTVVAVRDAMELTSKVTGKPYFMVRKHGTSKLAKPAKLGLDDVFADDKEFLSERDS